MSGPSQTSFEDLSRANARTNAQTGIATLARAFNHCGNGEVTYRYTDEVQSRFFELASDLVRLVETGEIESNPTHGPYMRAEAARGDKALQALIRRASKKTPIRKSTKGGGA